MPELINAIPQDVIDSGATSHYLGMHLAKAAAVGYSFPVGPRIRTISDCRVGEAEANRMGKLMDAIHGVNGTRQVLSLFDGVATTSSAISRALPSADVTGVDIDPETHQRGKYNMQLAGLTNRLTLVESDALSYLSTSGEFHAIFIDPLWPNRPEGYGSGTFSLTETLPPLTDIIPVAAEHSPLVVARVPYNIDVEEVIAMNDKLRRELFLDTYRIENPVGMRTKAAFFADTGNADVSTRESVFYQNQNAWEITVYQRRK